MAYIKKEEVKAIRDKIKKDFPQFKFSVTCQDYSAVRVSILKGTLDFIENHIEKANEANNFYPCGEKERLIERLKTRQYIEINHYHIDAEFTGECLEMLEKIRKIVVSTKPQTDYNFGDPSADYCDMNYYYSLQIGDWDKPYEYIEKV